MTERADRPLFAISASTGESTHHGQPDRRAHPGYRKGAPTYERFMGTLKFAIPVIVVIVFIVVLLISS